MYEQLTALHACGSSVMDSLLTELAPFFPAAKYLLVRDEYGGGGAAHRFRLCVLGEPGHLLRQFLDLPEKGQTFPEQPQTEEGEHAQQQRR